MANLPPEKKIRLEDIRVPSDLELEQVNNVYDLFYKWRSLRSGSIKQLQGNDFETYLKKSRQLFWNTLNTPSEDLKDIGLEFSIPFVRKEVMDFIGRIASQDFVPRINGEGLDIYGVKVLQAMYDRWRFHSNDRVEKFWELLYGQVNGTMCKFVGYNDAKLTRRFLTEYNNDGSFKIEEKERPYWNDVWTEIVPIEDIYLPKIWERNIQKQGKLIWKSEMSWQDFKSEFNSFDNAEYVYPGNQFAEDSLYFRLLDSAGVTAGDRVQVIKFYDVIKDEYVTIANGVWLNPVGKNDKKQAIAPNPFDHKMMPFVWGINDPIDEKFCYGLSLPFKIKDPHKLLNTSLTLMVEREFRAVDPPVLSSDFEAPKLIFGEHKVIPVNDVNAYKEMSMSEPSGQFMNMMNSLQGFMSAQSQGGSGAASSSRQPKSAREVLALENLKQQALGNALTMYYDILRQEIILMLKTALQFYPLAKYKKDKSKILRSITLPDYPLLAGGTGTLEVRFVKKKSADLANFFESVNRSMVNGKPYEIIEAPLDLIEGLEFEITSIDLQAAQADEMKKAAFYEQVIQPMINVYIPAGLADPGKVFLRHLEKMGEHPADYASSKTLPQLMQTWKDQTNVTIPKESPAPLGPTTGAVKQSTTGMQNGPRGGAPVYGEGGPLPTEA